MKRGAHLKNFVSMVGIDTMVVGGSDIAKNILRVKLFVLSFCEKKRDGCKFVLANGRNERI